MTVKHLQREMSLRLLIAAGDLLVSISSTSQVYLQDIIANLSTAPLGDAVGTGAVGGQSVDIFSTIFALGCSDDYIVAQVFNIANLLTMKWFGKLQYHESVSFPLRRLFRALDSTRTGTMSLQQLSHGLRELLSIDAPPDFLGEGCRLVCVHNPHGTLNFVDFFHLLVGNEKFGVLPTSQEYCDEIGESLPVQLVNFRRCALSFVNDGSMRKRWDPATSNAPAKEDLSNGYFWCVERSIRFLLDEIMHIANMPFISSAASSKSRGAAESAEVLPMTAAKRPAACLPLDHSKIPWT